MKFGARALFAAFVEVLHVGALLVGAVVGVWAGPFRWTLAIASEMLLSWVGILFALAVVRSARATCSALAITAAQFTYIALLWTFIGQTGVRLAIRTLGSFGAVTLAAIGIPLVLLATYWRTSAAVRFVEALIVVGTWTSILVMWIGGIWEFDPKGLDPLDTVQAGRAAIVLLVLTAPLAFAIARASWRARRSAELQTEG